MKGSVNIERQPTETSCGPTCLEAVYRYYGYKTSVSQIIKETPRLPMGGTLAVMLGNHALARGFNVKIYTYNLAVFDPSWFTPTPIGRKRLIAKLEAQMEAKAQKKLSMACQEYIRFLMLGGTLHMADLSQPLIAHHLKRGVPLLTGLSSTYLYMGPRERNEGERQIVDDVAGYPEGHFVIIEKFNEKTQKVTIADPYGHNPFSRNLRYTISMERLLTAMFLGIITYDANFVVITPKWMNEDIFQEIPKKILK